MVKPQDGLDAGGYLLMAKGHLVKAEETLGQEGHIFPFDHLSVLARNAANSVRQALELLKQEKEDTCNKP